VRTSFTISLCILLSSCSIIKSGKLSKQGEVNRDDFLVEVPYSNVKDWIVVTVQIEGKDYNFIWDTGADITVISERMAKNIEHGTVVSRKVKDSGKNKKSLNFIALPKVMMGEVEFHNIGAAIADLDPLIKQIGCDSIDGILGNNLMRKAVWQVNYAEQKLGIASAVDKLKLTEENEKVEMEAGKRGHPYFKTKVNGKKQWIAMDTGYNGSFKMPRKELEKIAKKTSRVEIEEATGAAGGGLYGARQGSTWNYQVESIELGNMKVMQPIISTAERSSSLIGNKFFEDFILTIDWKNKHVYFLPVEEITPDTLETFGFEFLRDFEKNQLLIGKIWLSQKDNIGGLRLGQRVLQVNEDKLENLSREEFCELFSEGITTRYGKEITITVDNKGERKVVTLTKKVLLPRSTP